VTFAEIAKPSSYRALPLIPKDRLKLLWFDDYYDGPKSGLLLFNGEKCWYETINDSMDGPEVIPYVDFRHSLSNLRNGRNYFDRRLDATATWMGSTDGQNFAHRRRMQSSLSLTLAAFRRTSRITKC
jgi:hypothetical protein